jgi:replicative DNA helicase
MRDGPTSEGRQPPHNLEAEQALLGALLIQNKTYDAVADFLRPEHFAQAVHGRIYQAIATLLDRGHVANGVTLKAIFDQDDALTEIGGAQYLGRLATSVVTIINAADYGRTIFDLWKRRQLIAVCQEVAERSYVTTLEETADTIAADAEHRLYEATLSGDKRGAGVSSADSVSAALNAMDAARRGDRRILGVTTGIPALDELIGGLEDELLYILAGRPSMGKSVLATCIGTAAARQFLREAAANGTKPKMVAEYQLEMSHQQVTTRRLAAETGIGITAITRGRVSDQEIGILVDAGTRLARLPILVDDTPSLTLAEIRTRARRLKRKAGGLGLIVIDYLALISPSKDLIGAGEVAQITETTKGLKALAKDLGVPVLALSQLSRAVETRDDKRPMLADLRSSGSIEQDADVVMFVYREHYYLAREEPKEKPGLRGNDLAAARSDWQRRKDDTENKAEILVEKQRQGATGKVEAYFHGAQGVFGAEPQRDLPL